MKASETDRQKDNTSVDLGSIAFAKECVSCEEGSLEA